MYNDSRQLRQWKIYSVSAFTIQIYHNILPFDGMILDNYRILILNERYKKLAKSKQKHKVKSINNHIYIDRQDKQSDRENYLTSEMSLYADIGKLSISKSSWFQTCATCTSTHPSDSWQFFTTWAPRNIVSSTLEIIKKSIF